MPFILAISLYLRLLRCAYEHEEISITDRNLTKVEWEKLVNHPFNEYEW